MILSTAAIAAMLVWLFIEKPKSWWIRISTAFVIAGGIGNMIDRIGRGYVVDFIDCRFIDFYVFNVADSFVTVGCILFVLLLAYEEYKNVKKKKAVLRLIFFFGFFNPFHRYQLITFLDAHYNNALNITLLDVDVGSRHTNDDTAVFNQHNIVIFCHQTAAGNLTGLGCDVVVLQTLTASGLSDLLAVGTGTQVFGQFGTLAEAVFGDRQQSLAVLSLFSAHNDVITG